MAITSPISRICSAHVIYVRQSKFYIHPPKGANLLALMPLEGPFAEYSANRYSIMRSLASRAIKIDSDQRTLEDSRVVTFYISLQFFGDAGSYLCKAADKQSLSEKQSRLKAAGDLDRYQSKQLKALNAAIDFLNCLDSKDSREYHISWRDLEDVPLVVDYHNATTHPVTGCAVKYAWDEVAF